MVAKEQVEQILAQLPVLEFRLSDPATAANQKLFRELVREHSALRQLQEKALRYFRIKDDMDGHTALIRDPSSDSELVDLARVELEDLQRALPPAEKDLLFALLPPDPTAARHAIMEIRAGTGGTEAALFAGDLFRMYSRYAANRGWKIGLIDASTSEIGGYKEVVFAVEGEEAYGHLRYECGVHRVQRIPVTEASGRIHTSTATVVVFPEVEAEDDIELDPQELRVDIFCSSGPGGQGVNTTYSAVRITHLPTGLVAQSQDERSQHRNKEKALSVLKARILDARRCEEEERMGNDRRSQIGNGDRSLKIRTYNFPQNRVTDHRINMTLYNLGAVIEGDIEELVRSLREHDLSLKLKARGLAAAG